MKKYNIAVVGASGVVGQKMLEVLEERNFPINELHLYTSKKSAGNTVTYCGKEYKYVELCEENINENLDIAFFSAGKGVSKTYAQKFTSNGTFVIDNSSAFRNDDSIPLVIPEVNADVLTKDSLLIANPNCSTSIAIIPINILDNLFGLDYVSYTTYQAVSGSGLSGIEDLKRTQNGEKERNYLYPIANNIIPAIDDFSENGYTLEELKMVNETNKILGKELQVNATCIRVPVENCHSVVCEVQLKENFDKNLFINEIKKSYGIRLEDDIANNRYPMPIIANDKDDVFIGRIRQTLKNKNSVTFLVVGDNIRKGAATNTIQIGEKVIKLLGE